MVFLNTEIINIVFLLWDKNYEVNNIKILIDPSLSGNYIDEKFLKERIDVIPTSYCIDNSPHEIPVEFSIPNKVDPHSFYIYIMPENDFPEKFRENGIILVLGHPWVEMTQYPVK